MASNIARDISETEMVPRSPTAVVEKCFARGASTMGVGAGGGVDEGGAPGWPDSFSFGAGRAFSWTFCSAGGGGGDGGGCRFEDCGCGGL